MKNLFIVINGFSTGASLISELTQRLPKIKFEHIITQDVETDLIQSKLATKSSSPFFQAEIVYDGNLKNLLQRLSMYNIVGVVCGCEGEGVILRDLLSSYFSLPNNDMEYLDSRINKFKMNEVLKAKNIWSIPQVIISSKEEFNFALTQFINYPLVLKPLDSADSDGFIYCTSRVLAVQAFEKLYHSYTSYGRLIEKILLQQFISGKEYAVNSISYNGKRYVTDIWEYDTEFTEDGLRLCHACSLIKSMDLKLVEYAFKCLDALGYYYGAAHTEIIKSADGKFYMVENGCRMMGGMGGDLLSGCLENTQLSALVTLYTEPDQLDKMQFGVKKYVKLVNLLSRTNGSVVSINNLDVIYNLPSYVSSTILVKPGTKVSTCNVLNRLAQVILKSTELTVLERDYKILQNSISSIFTFEV